jgi:hypothetical protein
MRARDLFQRGRVSMTSVTDARLVDGHRQATLGMRFVAVGAADAGQVVR